MKNVTFLFGAGASKGALPLVIEFEERIYKFFGKFSARNLELPKDEVYEITKEANPPLKFDIQQEFIEDLRWILNALKTHASIDTYAKKLYLKHLDDDLKRLKATLSAYLIFEQADNPLDYRYDTFFASILNNVYRLPDHIKILSWNYDFQIEKAYNNYIDDGNLFNAQENLNVISKYTSYKVDSNHFAIFKLNGTTSFYDKGNPMEKLYFNDINKKLDIELIDEVLEKYIAVKRLSNYRSSLSFAWEDDNQNDYDIIEKAILGAEKTKILVVIGYSFPFFNREVDQKIIGQLKQLEKVYIQAPNAYELKERFESILPDFNSASIILKEKVGQFFLPNEL